MTKNDIEKVAEAIRRGKQAYLALGLPNNQAQRDKRYVRLIQKELSKVGWNISRCSHKSSL